MAVRGGVGARRRDRAVPRAAGGRGRLALGLPPAIALEAISASGHASTGGDRTLNIVIDLLHSVATAAWIGGLLGLAVLVTPAVARLGADDRTRLAAAVVVRFSALALTAVAVLVVTGVYRALAEVSLGDLLDTGYGRVLLVKLGLFAVLLVGGAYNRMVVHPRLERAALGLDPDDRGAAAALRVSVRAELVLAGRPAGERGGAGQPAAARLRLPGTIPAVIDDATVRHVARLARLHLDPDEEARMGVELSGILEHVDAIQALDLDDVPPTTHVISLENVMRDDVPRPSLPVEEALREAPEVVEDRFAVVKFDS